MNFRVLLFSSAGSTAGHSLRFLMCILLWVSACFFLVSCKKEMTLEQARETAVSLSDAPLAVASDSGEDIVALLEDTPELTGDEARRLEESADRPLPEGAGPAELSRILSERSDAAWALGRYVQTRDDAEEALNLARRSGKTPPKSMARLLSKTARAVMVHGEFKKAEALYAESLEMFPHPGAYMALAGARLKRGDFEGGESATRDGLALIGKITARKHKKKGGSATSRQKSIKLEVLKHRLQAQLDMAHGNYEDAEHAYRALIRLYEQQGRSGLRPLIKTRGSLAASLAYRDALADAEFEAGRALAGAVALSGRNSALTADLLAVTVDVLLRRGRFREAERTARLRMDIYLKSGMQKNTGKYAEAEFAAARTLAAQGRYPEALKLFEAVRARMSESSGRSDRFGMRSPDYILTLAMTGNPEQALKLADAALAADGKRNFGKHTAELKGLKAVAAAEIGREKMALSLFAEAVPTIENEYTDTFNKAKQARLRPILESWMSLLHDLQGTPAGRELTRTTGLNPTETAFRTADRLASDSVRSSLSAGGIRAAAAFDPTLADLIRREQDSGLRVAAMEDTLSAVLASADASEGNEVNDLREKINLLSEARRVLRKEIESRFPEYSSMLDPEPPGTEAVRALLEPDETLLVIHPGRQKTLIWALSPDRPVHFASVPAGENELAEKVGRLRSALACNPSTLGDIPAFDLHTAHELYRLLIEPAGELPATTKTLIIAAGGPLGSLPFSVLTTAETKFVPDSNVLFRAYRKAPWLARKYAAVRIPSVSSLAALRSAQRTSTAGSSGTVPLIGFGDPVFSPDRPLLDETQQGTTTRSGLRVRSSGKTAVSSEEGDELSAQKPTIELLSPLPDTRTELLRIARTLNADADTALFMGPAADEGRIKSMDLSTGRVLVFATHALRPGDLQGLDQPALALSAPSVTGGTEDGLLTMAEIMPLRLNADWVVLSACDTGGGSDNAGSEALTGLGQAFFYAGSRALLVTLWPVETGSAAELTTTLFRYLADDPTLNRAEALNRSMLHLIDGPGIVDQQTGQTIADFAHPFFWAPFILAGEGGNRANSLTQ